MLGRAACCPLLGLGGPGLCLLRGCLSQALSLRFVPLGRGQPCPLSLASSQMCFYPALG